MITLEIIYEYLKKDNKVVKFTNVADFPAITGTTKTILEDFGLIHDQISSPSMECTGTLKQLQNDLILVGESAVGTNFCLDIQMRFVLFDEGDKAPYILNSSLEKYMRCTYAFSNFMEFQVFKETLGTWNESHPKYAAVLKDLLESEDPGCTNNVYWSPIIEEMEMGI
jgi:hypothetical protein